MAPKAKSVAQKGKAPAVGKRKRGGEGDDDKTGGGGKKGRNRAVLQFFEDEAGIDDEDDYLSADSIFDDDDDFVEEEFDIELKVKKESVKAQNMPFVPKEEEVDEAEFDRMMEERYKNHPRFKFANDDEARRLGEGSLPSVRDPTIWKVKCMVGRERHSAFCLMQKFVDLKSLGNKLQITSVFSVDHVKGFIFIEADKECEIVEACKGLCGIYYTRLAPVPRNDLSLLLSVRNKPNNVVEGMWVRVKSGKYKGDLGQVVAVNNLRKKATVKLIPRIDLQALAQKFGGGVALKNTAIPAPRLISSSELEEFRPLVQYRRDRDTGKMFEILDGLMLKDGFLYKKVSIDSLSCHGVMPSEDELLKFKHSENNDSDDLEWLTQLYGGSQKKRSLGNDKGGEKGESSSGSCIQNKFELYELVCFGRKDYGLVVGMEKGDYYKILKDGPELPIVVPVELRQLKNGPSDMKFTAFDQHRKTISVNDTVRIVEGSLKDREGVVKQIYRGTVFIYNENERENGGYFCCKAQMCEKVKYSFDTSYEKGGGTGPTDFEDFPSSPKSPLPARTSWLAKETGHDFKQGDKDAIFSIGQTLRIRVGPLKGYLCRVIAIRRSDVTVKLDSQQKVLQVKSEHLSELRGKSSAFSSSEDPGSSSFKPFDLLGTEGGSKDWADGAGTSTDGDRWNAGGVSNEGTFWPSFPPISSVLQSESNLANPSSSVDNDPMKDAGNAAWDKKVVSNQGSSWGAAATTDDKAVANHDQVRSWGKSEDGWNKAAKEVASSQSSPWGAQVADDKASGNSDQVGGWGKSDDGWSKAASSMGATSSSCWGKTEDGWNKAAEGVASNQTSSWGAPVADDKAAANGNEVGSKGKSDDPWSKPVANVGSTASDSWAKSSLHGEERASTLKDSRDKWGQANLKSASSSGDAAAWNKVSSGNENQISNCGEVVTRKNQLDSWGKGQDVVEKGSWDSSLGDGNWNKKDGGWDLSKSKQKGDAWSQATGSQDNSMVQEDCWGKAKWAAKDDLGECRTEWKGSTAAVEKVTGNWGSVGGSSEQGHTGSWNKPNASQADVGDTSWAKGGGESSHSNKGGKSSWGIQAGESSWGKKSGESSWGKQGGESSWAKQGGESSWGKQGGQSSWAKQGGESLWGKQEGEPSWNKQNRGNEYGGWKGSSGGGRGSGGRKGRGGEGCESGGWMARGGGGRWSGGEDTNKADSSWGNDGGSSGQGHIDSWNAQKTSWGEQGGKSSWDRQGVKSSWGKPGDDSSWGKQKGDSLSGKQGGDSFVGRQGGDSSWDRQGGNSSWDKQGGNSSSGKQWSENPSGKQGEDSSWGQQGGEFSGKQGASTWGKQGEDSAWAKQGGDSSGKRGDSSWAKNGGESDWGKQGRSSWNKGEGDNESRGWKRSYDGVGSGGQRGRGGGGWRGRGGGGQGSEAVEGGGSRLGGWRGRGGGGQGSETEEGGGGWSGGLRGRGGGGRGSGAGEGWKKTGDDWCRPISTPQEQAGSSSYLGDKWGQEKPSSGNSSWGNSAWHKEPSSWGDGAARNNQPGSWGKGNDEVQAGSWSKNGSSNSGVNQWNNKEHGWNQPQSIDKGDSLGKVTDNAVQEGSWGKAAGKWGKKDDSSGSKVDWNASAGGWGNSGGSCGLKNWCNVDGSSSHRNADDAAGNWGNKNDAGGSKMNWDTSAGGWSSAAASGGQRNTDNWATADGSSSQRNDDKTSGKWGSKDDSSGSKTDWNTVTAGGWGNAGESGGLKSWGSADGSGSCRNVDTATGEWGNKDDSGGSKTDWITSGGWGIAGGSGGPKNWGNADGSRGHRNADNAAGKWGNKDDSGGRKTDRNTSAGGWASAGGFGGHKNTDSWGNADGGSSSRRNADGWNKLKADAEESSWSKKDGGSTWN